MEDYSIHISDVRAFKSCRRKWDFSSTLRRGLEKDVTYMPFFTGRAIHESLQRFYEDGVHPVQAAEDFFAREAQEMGILWDNELELITEQIELVRGMLAHYMEWTQFYTGPLCDDKLTFIALETEFSVPFRIGKKTVNRIGRGKKAREIRLEGRFDGLVRHANGSYWIWEVKTSGNPKSLVESLAMDEQASVYAYAAREMFGVPVTGILYQILRKKVPTTPRTLQDGTLSKAANIDTTAARYKKAIDAHHPDMSNDEKRALYGDIIETLAQKDAQFFIRTPIYKTPAEIDNTVRGVLAVAEEMTSEKVVCYPSPDWLSCRFCSFRAPCLAMTAGADAEFILKQEFRPRTKWSPLSGELTEEGGGSDWLYGRTA